MPNMSYCRFENTWRDLRDCFNDWDVESESEQKAQAELIKLCRKIVMDYGDTVDSNALFRIDTLAKVDRAEKGGA